MGFPDPLSGTLNDSINEQSLALADLHRDRIIPLIEDRIHKIEILSAIPSRGRPGEAFDPDSISKIERSVRELNHKLEGIASQMESDGLCGYREARNALISAGDAPISDQDRESVDMPARTCDQWIKCKRRANGLMDIIQNYKNNRAQRSRVFLNREASQ